ncbi:hypothetical protein FRC12_024650 [Ceratobasidium sp. 428]|nr:hypothetical protein FRC12_024650 [Ceratobasidium sp. 428]
MPGLSNQCPYCLEMYRTPGLLASHQLQTQHWRALTPDLIEHDESIASAPVASTSDSPAPANDNSMHDPSLHSDPFAGLSPTHASTPLQSDHDSPPSPQVTDPPKPMHPLPNDPAPYGVATNEAELRASIRRILEDMIGQHTGANPAPPQPSSSAQGDGTATSSGSAPAQPNRFVTMQKLPDNIDDALTQFFSHLFCEEQPQEDANPDPDPDDQDSEVSDAPHDTRSEAGSEMGSEQFYTTANNSNNNLAGDTHPQPATPIPASIPDDIANSPWGTPLRRCQPMLDKIYQDRVAADRLPDWPFADFLEFEFVKWMVVNDISQTARDKLIKLPMMERCGLSFGSNYALNKLLDKLPSTGPRWTRIQRMITGTIKDANGKNLTEDIEIWVRDIIDVIRELIGNTTYGQKLVFVPQRVKVNSTRKIDEMWTADWWMRIQQQLPPGSTIIPIVLSSDSTQLTNFSGAKSAWPVYITLGNIPKSIRAKINSYSSLLLAYLPIPKFDCFPPSVRGDQKACLFHKSMTQILEPLIGAGKDGVEMDCGDGYVWHCYPLLAAHIANNPEQTLVAGCKCNLCHRCTVKHDERGNLPEFPAPPCIPDHTAVALEAHDFGHTSSLFDEQGLKPFGKPFWADLPHANIFSALTPDILHQLHKGVFKDHLMEWCLLLIHSLYGSANKVDYRYKAMPDHSSLRHFTSGVTKLKQTTAHEHREMQKVFTVVVAGLVPEPVLPVVLAAIDFIHFARFPSHTPETLALLDNALNHFHQHKHIFIDYGVRDHFNINKLHAMCHYVEAIQELGALDAYNTETPEQLHIEFAKCAYKATNRRDFFNQMTTYLERREKVNKFDAYLQSIYPEYAARDLDIEKNTVDVPRPFPLVLVALLPELYGIKWFKDIMSNYFWDFHQDKRTKVEDGDTLKIYPKATQIINDVFATELVD